FRCSQRGAQGPSVTGGEHNTVALVYDLAGKVVARMIVMPNRQSRNLFTPVATFALSLALAMGLCTAISASAAVASTASPDNGAIDAIFADYDKPDAPGCALGVIQDGEFIYRRGYGMANLEYDIPIDSNSVFRTGSVVKQFTAAVIALMAESGAIQLDDPLSQYFPAVPAWVIVGLTAQSIDPLYRRE